MGGRSGAGGGGGGGASAGISAGVAGVGADLKKQFGLEFKANGGAGLVTVAVSVDKVNASWSQDKGFYVAPGGGGQKAANVRSFLDRAAKDGTKVEQSRMSITGGVSFTDGRHRFAALRDMGAQSVLVSVPRSEAAAARKQFGAN